MSELLPGLTAELELCVTEADTASRWGSGLVPVFSTPALVGLMEGAAVRAIQGGLAPGQTTVGGHIDIHHLAATPVGMGVHARAKLTAVDGRKLTFRIEAWDEVEPIGEAVHERFIIDEARFVAKAQAKGEKRAAKT
ncbi:MAG: thioesterase family protein [Anaerolineales bacterium]